MDIANINSIVAAANLTLKVVADTNFQKLAVKPTPPVSVLKVELEKNINTDNLKVYRSGEWLFVENLGVPIFSKLLSEAQQNSTANISIQGNTMNIVFKSPGLEQIQRL
jgi:hypothetical protein